MRTRNKRTITEKLENIKEGIINTEKFEKERKLEMSDLICKKMELKKKKLYDKT